MSCRHHASTHASEITGPSKGIRSPSTSVALSRGVLKCCRGCSSLVVDTEFYKECKGLAWQGSLDLFHPSISSGSSTTVLLLILEMHGRARKWATALGNTLAKVIFATRLCSPVTDKIQVAEEAGTTHFIPEMLVLPASCITSLICSFLKYLRPRAWA